MDWQDIGVLVAMIGVVGGFVLTWRGQQQDKQISEATAERAEAAARITDENTERVLVALETIAAKDFSSNVALQPAPPPRVRWAMRHYAGDTYSLTNVGSAPAFDVELSAHDSMGGLHAGSGGPDLGPDEALTFLAAPSMGTTDRTITVTWLDARDATDRHTWRIPLPARPRR